MAKSLKDTKENNKEDRMKALMEKMEKDFGKGTVMGAKDKPLAYECISTGSIGLNKALGIGGYPKGRIIEVFGPESSGKTTLCLEAMAEAHKDPSMLCAIIDVEHSVDLSYAEALGVDLDRLKISQPDYGEQALEIAERFIESGLFAVVVIDSVAALVPKAELEGEMGDSTMGKQARLMSQALRKLTGLVSKSNTILFFTNQMRDKIGVMFGSPETTTGGNALKYYASVRLDIRRSLSAQNAVMDGEVKIGNQTTVKVIKNKVAPPFRSATFDILYGEGFDTPGEVLDMAVECGVINKSGTFYNFEGTSIGQGRDKARQFLIDNEGVMEEVKKKVTDTFKPKVFKATEKEVVDAG